MEFPAAVFLFLLWATRRASVVPIYAFLPLFEIHDLRQSIVFPFLMSSFAKLIPTAVDLMAIFFNSLNGSGFD
jgi:hypothetical protein